MVISKIDSDAILFELIRNKAAGDMVKAWQCAINYLKDSGLTPKHKILNNEILSDYKKVIK